MRWVSADGAGGGERRGGGDGKDHVMAGGDVVTGE